MPVTHKYYTAANEARRIPLFTELGYGATWQYYESAKNMLAELETWDMNHVDGAHAGRLRAEAQKWIADFEKRFPDAHYHIQEIWEYDLMPPRSVVEDFYTMQEFGKLQQDQALWERISEKTLDATVPGEACPPQAQWRVTLPSHDGQYSLTWMIYQWRSGSGPDDESYLYDHITPPTDFAPDSAAIQREVHKRRVREDH